MNSGDFLVGQQKLSLGAPIMCLCVRRTLVDVLGGSLVMSRVLFKIAAIFSKTERLVGFFCIVLGNRCTESLSMFFID